MLSRTDTVSKKKRSEIMRAVRSRGNRVTELVLVRLLRRVKINGWRRHAGLLGNPDFVFVKQKVALFVDGCFWHGCAKHCRMPKGNSSYWNPKIASNKARDARVSRTLRRAGWRVLRIWEHDLARNKQDRCMMRITQALAVRRARKGDANLFPHNV
jgi:DNA mismatch endonuclease, patch repair protein